ncbi:uncharacterized protein LOC141804743 [Halichoeres trimaculatus]|uniref:uncharacterized protein LOC141804743 n=1 Tax=Halichoeres trimaculatus TaxID=147232 RepID=UPI003D9EE638
MTGRLNVPWTTAEVQTFLGIIGEEAVQRELDGAVRNEKVFRLVSERMAVEGYTRTPDQCRSKCKKLRAEYRKIKDHNSRSGVQRKNWRWFDLMDAIYGSRPASRGREGAMDTASSLLERIAESYVEDPSTSELDGIEEEDSTTPAATGSSSSPPSPARTSTPAPGSLDRVQPNPAGCPLTPRGRQRRGQSNVAAALWAMQAADERHRSTVEEQQERVEERQERHFQLLLEDVRDARRTETDLSERHMAQTAAFNNAFLQTLNRMADAMFQRSEGGPSN